MLPPTITGYQKFDPYATEGNKGDVAKAKESLKASAVKPNGFKTTIAVRNDRQDEVDAATAVVERR